MHVYDLSCPIVYSCIHVRTIYSHFTFDYPFFNFETKSPGSLKEMSIKEYRKKILKTLTVSFLAKLIQTGDEKNGERR